MGEIIDVEAQRRLQTLVQKATDKRQFSLDPDVLRDIKGMCKVSDQNVHTAFAAISVALKANHAQTRLLAVELADVLFQRSRVFRGLLAPALTAFLVAAVGFRKEDPLPPPAATAVALRERTLEVLESWNQKFGSMYHQVALGCNYLKNTLRYQFPEVHDRSTAERARVQQQANEAYARLRGELEAGLAEVASTLQQLGEALSLAEAAAPPATDAATTADDEGMDWADAAVAGETAAAADSDDEGEGLSAYAAADATAAGQEPGQTPAADQAAGATTAGDPAVAETILGLQRLVTSRHLPSLQRWLDILTKADVGAAGTAERAARDRMLRQAAAQRSAANEAMARIGAVRTRLPALDTALDAAAVVRERQLPAAPERTASPAISDPEILESARRHAALKDPAAARSPWTLDARFSGKMPKGASPAKSLVRTAALASLNGKGSPSKGAAAAESAAAAGSASGGSTGGSGSGSSVRAGAGHPRGQGDSATRLKEDVKRKLLMQAPLVEAGGHLQYWEGGSTPSAMRSGMEISNHWGAVNHDAQINLAQLEGMAAHHVPQYWTPSAAKTTSSSPAPPAELSLSDTDAKAVSLQKPQASTITRIGFALPSRLGGKVSIGSSQQQPRQMALSERLQQLVSSRDRQEAGSDLQHAAGDSDHQAAAAATTAADNPSAGTHAAVAAEPPPFARNRAGARPSRQDSTPATNAGLNDSSAAGSSSPAATGRLDDLTGAAAAKAYNKALLAAARTDEEVAQSVAAAEAEEAKTKGRKRKAPASVKDRLTKKLLNRKDTEPRLSKPGKDFVWIK